MKIATTTADFERYVSSRGDVCDILPMLKKSGFSHVDLNLYRANQPGSPLLTDGWRDWVSAVKAKAAELGMDFVQAHSSDSLYDDCPEKERLTDCIRRQLEVCGELGIPGMTVHGIAKPGIDREEFMEANTVFYRDLLKTAEQYNVMIYTENTCHKNGTTYFLYDGSDMNELVARVNHPLFGICWDVGHAYIDNVNQYNAIVKMGKNLKAVHIHDNLGLDYHLQPYSGGCSYDPIVKGLADAGFAGTFTLEAYSLPSPDDFVGRKPLELNGVVYDRLVSLPLELKIRSEALMFDVTKFMLQSYDCFEE